ncbi:MAG TPA: shikimate kinase [Thermodesulfobacteriota bacterium]|nr:shikimate kinase [Thermodesulfobacteriota bacterium]
MNIVLIGYRGTGKSTIAKILSARLKWPRFNLDEGIVKDTGMSIPQIVEKHGWEFFRDLEARIVEKAGNMDKTIIDAGGGVVVRPKNIERLRRNGVIIWLKAKPETIISRIKEDTNRPSLTRRKSFLEEVQEVLAERIPKYQAAAHVAIDTDNLSPQDVAEKIIEAFNRFNAG